MNRVTTPTSARMALIGLLLLVLVSAEGCSLFSQKEIIPQGTEQESALDKRTGTVGVQLDAQTKKITYVLNTENGETITLQSVAINLDRYAGRKVEVQGIYEPREQRIEVQDVTTLSEELSLKQEYMNAAVGVSFQYPKNWYIDESRAASGELTVYPYNVPEDQRNAINKVVVQRLENASKLSPKDWFNLDEFFRPSDPKTVVAGQAFQESVVGKKQYPAVKLTRDDNQIQFYVQRDTFMYSFGFTATNLNEREVDQNAFYELVSSFDFIPFNSSALGISTPLTPATTPPASIAVGEPNPATPTDKPYLTFNYDAYKAAIGDREKFLPEQYKGKGYSEVGYDYTLESDNATPNGVYITFGGAEPKLRIYLAYKNPKDPTSAVYKAAFEQVDGVWVLKDGVNEGKGKARVMTLPEEDAQKILIKAGMQLIQSTRFKASFQVPASWYWGLTPEGYAFDSKPLSTRPPLAVLSNELKIKDDMAQKTSDSGLLYYIGMHADGRSMLCAKNKEATYCVLFTDQSLASVALQILESFDLANY